MNLYSIASEYRQQLAALADLDMPPEAVADTVEGMSGELESKLRAVIAYSLELDVLATGAADAAKRMQDRARTLQNRVEWLRTYALQAMQGCGIGEVATDEFAARVAKKPASVQIAEGAVLPAEYLRTKTITEPNKTAIGEALKAGKQIENCTLVQGYRLAIK
jgi:hypothetical protein